MSRPDELTGEESDALAAAIFQAMEDGHHDQAEALGQLAADPAKLRRVLAGEEEPAQQ